VATERLPKKAMIAEFTLIISFFKVEIVATCKKKKRKHDANMLCCNAKEIRIICVLRAKI
jgi:hypothetical protein